MDAPVVPEGLVVLLPPMVLVPPALSPVEGCPEGLVALPAPDDGRIVLCCPEGFVALPAPDEGRMVLCCPEGVVILGAPEGRIVLSPASAVSSPPALPSSEP